MAIAVILHVLHSIEELSCHVSNFVVLECTVLYIIKQFAHRRVLLNSVDNLFDSAITLSVIAILADAMELDDVRVGRAGLKGTQFTNQVLH